jgi:hypothetical protein
MIYTSQTCKGKTLEFISNTHSTLLSLQGKNIEESFNPYKEAEARLLRLPQWNIALLEEQLFQSSS